MSFCSSDYVQAAAPADVGPPALRKNTHHGYYVFGRSWVNLSTAQFRFLDQGEIIGWTIVCLR
jgi:hypothetical protein